MALLKVGLSWYNKSTKSNDEMNRILKELSTGRSNNKAEKFAQICDYSFRFRYCEGRIISFPKVL